MDAMQEIATMDAGFSLTLQLKNLQQLVTRTDQ